MNSKISNKKDIIYSVCLAVIVFAVFSISIHYQFLESFDDNGHVLHNRYLTFSFTSITYWLTHACVGCYMPLTMLSYIFDYSLWGLNSFGFHLQNIFWHIVATIAIYSCFRLFKIKSWIAFFLCLIFAVHPQRVESVVWISERKDVLCAAFYFLSIFFYIKNNNKKFNITAFILFILAILSKPMAISLPVVLVLYEFYIYGKSRGQRAERTEIRGQRAEVGDQITAKKNTNPDRRDTRRMSETCNVQATVIRYAPRTSIKSTKIIRLICLIRGLKKLFPYFLILFIFIPISIIAQSNAGAVHSNNFILSFNRLYILLYNIYWYSAQTLFCFENSPMYHPHVITFYSILEIFLFYIGAATILVTVFIKNKRLFLFILLPLALAYLITLLPVIGLIKLGPTDHADRYSYIPSVFIWFSIGLIINWCFVNKSKSLSKIWSSLFFKHKFVFVLLSCYTIILIFLNIQYQRFWKNNYTLFYYANTYYHVNAHILISLADMELAKKNYGRVLELTRDLNNDKKWKLIADFYKVSILFNENREQSLKPLLQLKALFKKNLTRKIFVAKYIKINEMLASFPGYRNLIL